jgi:hypothetical protein
MGFRQNKDQIVDIAASNVKSGGKLGKTIKRAGS